MAMAGALPSCIAACIELSDMPFFNIIWATADIDTLHRINKINVAFKASLRLS